MTHKDTDVLLAWLNEEPIVWIVKESQDKWDYRWRAIRTISALDPGMHRLWHPDTERLVIPSGSSKSADIEILNPFSGWNQRLSIPNACVPWFGAPHPGTFGFTFTPQGREQQNSIGRSGFQWVGNYFRPVGIPATMTAEKWWARLRRFIQKRSIGIPWPPHDQTKRVGAYAFPEAYNGHVTGRHLDTNP